MRRGLLHGAALSALSCSLTCAAYAQAQPVPPAPSVQQARLDPESPMAELPGLDVAWPDMPGGIAPSQTSDTVKATEDGMQRRYSVVLESARDLKTVQFMSRFDSLSALKSGEGKTANVAQLDRRAKEDAVLLEQILRAEGYYTVKIDPRIETDGNAIKVTMAFDPGPQYSFSKVNVAGLDGAGAKAEALRDSFAVEDKDPLNADDVIAGEANLRSTIAKSGFPFAKVGAPKIVVDHNKRTATLDLNVETGGERSIGGFIVAGDKAPFSAKHVSRLARFGPGDTFDQNKIDDLKRAIIATGLVSSVSLEPTPAADPTKVDVTVQMTPAPMRTIAGELGYDTGEGVRVSANWTHRNLLPPEGAVTFRGLLGTREQSVGALLRRSNFGERDRVLSTRISASNINQDAFQARTLEIGASLERQTSIIWQRQWTWSTGLEFLASDERDIVASNLQRRTFYIGSLPLMIGFDGSNDLLDPTKGFRLSARVTPELSIENGTNGYARVQLDGSFYWPVRDNVVIASRGRIGYILGSSLNLIAPSRRFYSGGGGSVRGYGYQDIGPRDAFNDPIGGRSILEFGLESRIRLGNFAIVPFIDGGNVYSGLSPSLSGFRFGAGVGGRYHSAFGPIRIDIGTPLNPQAGDTPITVHVSLGQAF
jgi:translocation and assembly module TamA